MSGVLIAAPVYNRAWVLESWFDSVEAQGLDADFLFGLSSSEDATEEIIRRRAPRAEVLRCDDLRAFEEDEKDDDARYGVLATIRNRLLDTAITLAPNQYVSWDTDILMDPGALEPMLNLRNDAVGALVDMGGDVHPGHLSWMTLEGGEGFRPLLGAKEVYVPEDGTPRVEGQTFEEAASARARRFLESTAHRYPFKVGVIMGVKVLRPAAYTVGRYADHVQGEDVGFALSLEAAGVERWLCPQARGRHLYRLA